MAVLVDLLKNLARRVVRTSRRTAGVNASASLKQRFPEVPIGVGTYGDLSVLSWDATTKLKIGSYCSIGKGVKIVLGGEHRTDWVTTYPFSALDSRFKHIEGHPASKGDISIGNDVWIGMGATILSGVSVGDGAVIGAGAVVSKDVSPYSIVSGNPASFKRLRFAEIHIQELLEIAWWDWPEEKIKKAVPDLLSQNIENFIRRSRANFYDHKNE